jgi:hypothetical protein
MPDSLRTAFVRDTTLLLYRRFLGVRPIVSAPTAFSAGDNAPNGFRPTTRAVEALALSKEVTSRIDTSGNFDAESCAVQPGRAMIESINRYLSDENWHLETRCLDYDNLLPSDLSISETALYEVTGWEPFTTAGS